MIDPWYVAAHTALTVLATIGGILWLPFTKVGERMLGHVFDRKLEKLRHDQDSKIEELRSLLSQLSDRGLRSNELEFDAVISAWNKFVEADLATNRCVIRFTSYPDFGRMSDEEIRSYLGTTEFSEIQKQEVLESKDRIEAYARVLEFRALSEANNMIFEARQTLKKKSIFIPEPLESQFEAALQLALGAYVQQNMQFRYKGNPDMTRELKAVDKSLLEGQASLEALKAAVRKRLHVDLNG